LKIWPTWLGLLAGVVALAAGLLAGPDLQKGWQLAARYTARVSFPFFLVAFVASSILRLHRRPWTIALLRDRRWWGLGFASCFFVHLVALLTYNWLIDNFPPAGLLDRGVWAYAVLLAMVLTSTNRTRRRMGHWWVALHRIGMWGFFFIFVLSPYADALLALKMPDFNPPTDPYTLAGVAFLAVRIAAWWRSRAKPRIAYMPPDNSFKSSPQRGGLTQTSEVRMKVCSIVAASIIVASIAPTAHASDPSTSPLIGNWVLCQDPDNSPKDTLQFFPEGYGFSVRPNKPKSPFLFKEAVGQVMLAINAKGNLLTINLGVNPDNSRLTLKSDRTGNESFYVREGQEEKNSCTAK
jgi:methionine sulfoxide reductase heme-binding subunit